MSRLRWLKRKSNRSAFQRRLRTEWLEQRSLMAGDTVHTISLMPEDVNDDETARRSMHF